MTGLGKNHRHRGRHSELLATVWLLEAGWEVFQNVAPSGPADLTIWNPVTAEVKLVDVKTVTTRRYKRKCGGEVVDYSTTIRKSQCPQVHLLFVYHDGRVTWESPKLYYKANK